MSHELFSTVFQSNTKTDDPPELKQAGSSDHNEVSELAVNAVSTAVRAVQLLCKDVYNASCPSSVDRHLVDLWCGKSFAADGWQMPGIWNDFSQDYATNDGFIRLHCNAQHHRETALGVLGGASNAEDVKSEALTWNADALQDAIVGAGGCAAKLHTTEQWLNHPQGKAVAKEPIVAWHTGTSNGTTWRGGQIERPLQGLKVLDLTRIIAGPVATRFLASLGADVLRIDPPEWVEGVSEIELTVGKSCAELDLKQESGRNTFISLLQSADILVHGYRKEALQRLGFDQHTLAELNPNLMSVSLTAYGWSGPWANRRGFDSLVQRSSGLAINQDGNIIDLPYQVLDHATGYLMAASAVEAIRQRTTNHIVSHARLSLARQAKILTDAQVNAGSITQHSTVNQVQVAKSHGKRETTPWGNGWRAPLPYNIQNVKLGWNQAAHPLRSKPALWPDNNGAIT